MAWPHRTARCLVAVGLLGCRGGGPEGVPAPDRSSSELPSFTVPRGARALLDQGGPSLGGFVHPGTGRAVRSSRVQGDAWLRYDDEGLHLRVDVYDPTPDAPFDPATRDAHLWERSSGVELMLQPGDPGDNRDYFEIQVDSRGARWTTRFDDYNHPIRVGPDGRRRFGDEGWEPDLALASERLPGGRGYRVRFTVRWQDLQRIRAVTPPRAGDVWRANVYTFRDGQRDSLAWSPLLGQGNFHRSGRWGRLRFGP